MVVLAIDDRVPRLALTTRDFPEAAKGLPITFHRAFDMTIDAFEALDTCMKLGLSRVLTSGQKNKAINGVSFNR